MEYLKISNSYKEGRIKKQKELEEKKITSKYIKQKQIEHGINGRKRQI